MKKIMHRAVIALALVAVAFPGALLAQSQQGTGSDDPGKPTFQIVSCSGVDDPRTPEKKEVECDYDQLVATVYRAIKFVLYLLVPILLGMILYTGWKFLTAGGDAMKLESAKKMFKPVFVGLILIFGAWLFVYTILNTLLADNLGNDQGTIKKSDIVPRTN